MSEDTEQKIDYSPKRIAWLTTQLSSNLNRSIGEIQEINDQTKIISINAKITSAKAGEAGRSFNVVAEEIMNLSKKTATVADALDHESKVSIEELTGISNLLDTHVRGERLSIYSRTNIDLIDRNLYERSCDVRWWATDNSLVEALANPTPESIQYASERLGVILSAYTVYYDLVIADTSGNIVANGRPELYNSLGKNVSDQQWYQQAINSHSGDEYGLQSVHQSQLVSNERSLIYSCSIREHGDSTGKVIGALGIIFNWDGLAQVVVNNTPLDGEEWGHSRVCITDSDGKIIADSKNKQLVETLSFKENHEIFSSNRGYLETEYEGKKTFIAHAPAEGFETYNSGWFSIVIQQI